MGGTCGTSCVPCIAFEEDELELLVDKGKGPAALTNHCDEELEDDPPSGPEPGYLPRARLGPQIDAYMDDKADWRYEQEGKWRSYPVPESLALERHWRLYKQLQDDPSGSDAYLTKLKLMKEATSIDLRTLTAKAASGSWKIRREERPADWLSNAYFFEAFKSALLSAKISVDLAPQEMFDFRQTRDYRTLKDDGRKKGSRGGKEYEVPFGWKRFAVHVRGKYDEGDDQWLASDDSGWAVAYHGTSEEGLPGILGTGFNVGARQKFEATTGKGVYCTPWIDVAQVYSKPKAVKGHFVQIVLQLRVKPSSIKKTPEQFSTDFEKKYWVINDPADIRAYGVLIREFSLRDWVPPEVMVFGRDSPYAKKPLEDLQKEIEKAESDGLQHKGYLTRK